MPSVPPAALLAELSERSPDTLVLASDAGIVSHVGPAAAASSLFGPAPERLVGRPLTALFAESSRELLAACLREARASGGARCVLSALGAGGAPCGVDVVARLVTGEILGLWLRPLADEELSRLARARRYEAQIALIGALSLVVGLDGRIRDASERWEAVLGFAPADLVGRSYRELVHPDDLEPALRSVRDSVVGAPASAPRSLELRFRTKGGAYRTLLWSAAIDPDAAVVHAVAHDVTEHREREVEQRRLAARNEGLLAALPDLTFHVDALGTIVDFRTPDPELLLVPPALFLGRLVQEVLPHDIHAAYELAVAEARRTSAVQTFEYELPLGGVQRAFEARLAVLDGDAGSILVARDITDRKRAEWALLSSRHRLEEAQAMTNLGSWEYDLASGALDWSDQLHRLLRIDKTDAPPTLASYLERVAPRDRGAVEQAFARLLEAGESFDLFHEIVLPDGDRRIVHARAAARRDGARVVNARGTAQDRTDEKRAELEAIEAREAAITAYRARSQFLANMSHEMRTPLNGVLGMTSLALQTELTAEQRDLIEGAHRSGQALLSVIDDLLDLSKMDAHRLELESVPFSLRDLVDETARSLAPRADERSLELYTTFAAGVPARVVGDPLRLRQVLTNLLGNALKFTHEGEVEILVERAAGDLVSVSVRDTGIGVPEDRKEAIFEPFTQADGSTTRRYGGTGLGLTICRQLVALMGGRLWVDSAPGAGATFHFTAVLPPSPDAPGEEPSLVSGLPTLAAPGASPARRALVVDDHEGARAAVVASLRALGLEAEGAVGADDARVLLDAWAREGRPAALVVADAGDQSSPAWALERALAEQGYDAIGGPRIWLVTTRRGPRLSGVTLRKPVPLRELHAAVAEALRAPARRTTEAPTSDRALRILVAAADPRAVVKLVEVFGHHAVPVESATRAVEVAASDAFDLALLDAELPGGGGLSTAARLRAEPRSATMPVALVSAAVTEPEDPSLLAAQLAKPVRAGELRSLLAEIVQQRAGR